MEDSVKIKMIWRKRRTGKKMENEKVDGGWCENEENNEEQKSRKPEGK